jgi:uncharacterized membrane protein (DUF485 family)
MTQKAPFDPYAVLGVPPTATDAEIRAAYRDLGAKYHPDRHQGNPLEDLAADKMAEINRAYEILSDPERRAAFDRGQAGWPRPVDSPVTAARARQRNRWLVILGLLFLLPLLLRLGLFAVRLLVRLFRVGGEGLAVLRGTPAAGVAVLVAAVVLTVVLVRRRRRRAR